MTRWRFLCACLGMLCVTPVAAQEKASVGEPYTPAADKKGAWHVEADPALPHVLIEPVWIYKEAPWCDSIARLRQVLGGIYS